MISERVFSRSYGSFWKDLLPFSEAFVRGLNSRWPKPDEPGVHRPEPMQRAVVNEAAVRLYRRLTLGEPLDMARAQDAINEASAWLNCVGIPIEDYGLEETLLMAGTLVSRFGHTGVIFSPEFRGCGILSSCAADFITADVLVEVKSGHRTFRSSDFRQVLIYLSLNLLDGSHKIERICLYNPRLWRELLISVDDLCLQMGGTNPADVLHRIADFVSTGVISGL